MLMVALLCGLLVLSALAAGAETAVFSLRPAERRRLAARSAQLSRALAEPASLLVALLLANLVVNVAYFSVSASLSLALIERGHGLAGAALAAVSVVVLVIGGEILPKTAALADPATAVVRVAPVLSVLRVVLSPAVLVAAFATQLVERLVFGRRMVAGKLGAADFKSALTSSGAMGVYRAVELALLHDVVDFGQRKARNLMVPRVDVVFLDLAESRERWLAAMAADPHGVYPVCAGSPDEIRGTVLAVDVLTQPDRPRHELVEPPLLAPVNLGAERLVERMAAEGARLAVLLDEYGGVAGVVSLSALTRSVLGEIAPRVPAGERRIEPRRGASLLVRGDCPLHVLAEEMGLTVRTRRADTVGGAVGEAVGRLPRLGDEIEVDGWRLRVVRLAGRRVDAVLARPARLGGDGEPTAERAPEEVPDAAPDAAGRVMDQGPDRGALPGGAPGGARAAPDRSAGPDPRDGGGRPDGTADPSGRPAPDQGAGPAR